MQASLTEVRHDNELLRAQVDEADYWIYDRGPIEQELNELRVGSFVSEREIDRLTRENTRLMEGIRRADAMVPNASRVHARHEPGHPPQERSSITQTFVNNLFQRARGDQNHNAAT